jgi:flagellar L-ring protein precursor FlgH
MGLWRSARPALVAATLASAVSSAAFAPARADDLFAPGRTQSLASDRRASQAGDIVTIVVVQAAESSSIMQNGTRRSTAIGGRVSAGSFDEGGDLTINNTFDGRGEVRRSERFVTQMSASITGLLPNGDLEIGGNQSLFINGETTMVEVRGRIRPADIDAENRVPSNRIADAQIRYNGKGFISRSAKPGIVHRIFGFLGLS